MLLGVSAASAVYALLKKATDDWESKMGISHVKYHRSVAASFTGPGSDHAD